MRVSPIEPAIHRQRLIVEGHFTIPTKGEDILSLLTGLSDVLDMRVFSGPYAWHPGSKDQWTNPEVPLNELNGFVAWTESGAHVYAWRPQRFFTVDCYSCKPFDVEAVEEYVNAFFGSTDSSSLSIVSQSITPPSQSTNICHSIAKRAFRCAEQGKLNDVKLRIFLLNRLAKNRTDLDNEVFSYTQELWEAKRSYWQGQQAQRIHA